MEFHKKLYELRKKNGLSQEELAGKLNVTRQTISKWELGESTPDMEKLVMLGDYFNISLDELVLGKTTGEPNNSKENGEEKNLHVCQKMVTEENRNRARRGLKIMGIVLGVFFLIDIISLIVCLVLYGILG
ncbi:MAG: helix-turn-helix domain-containing protein [Lachnospiraceae bacterium]|nr:helix-turn-helix domain-containing protein [Lachnospiraceae bacterium]